MMQRIQTPFLNHLSLCGIITLMTGCAALTIDVDVYKGPLVDDIHVQTESTTVLAMGAKPLLIQLRNTLEEEAIERANINSADHWDYPEGEHDHAYPFAGKSTCLTGRQKILEFQNNKNYGQGFIGESYEFCGEEPFRVNAVLSLYDNRNYDPITAEVQKIKHAIRDWKIFKPILFPIDTSERMKLWDNLKTAFEPDLQQEIDRSLAEEIQNIEDLLALMNKELAACLESSNTDPCKFDRKSKLVATIDEIPIPESSDPKYGSFKALGDLKTAIQKKIKVEQSFLKNLVKNGNPYDQKSFSGLFKKVESLFSLVGKELKECKSNGNVLPCQIAVDSPFVETTRGLIEDLGSLEKKNDSFKLLRELKSRLHEITLEQTDLQHLISTRNPYFDDKFISKAHDEGLLKKALVTAYKDFLAPEKGLSNIRTIFMVHETLKRAGDLKKILRIKAWPSTYEILDSSDIFDEDCNYGKGKKYQKTGNLSDEKKRDCDASSTSMFLALVENKKQIINLHADLLFSYESDQKRSFIAEVIKVAKSFVKLREATQQIYRALLSVNHLMAMPGKDIAEIRKEHGEEIPKMIAGLTRGKYLINALEEIQHSKQTTESNLFETFLGKQMVYDLSVLKPIDWLGLEDEKLPKQKTNAVHSEKIRKRLIKQLTGQRVRTSDLFLYLDQLYASQSSETDYRPAFGITGGPAQAGFTNVMDTIIDQVNTAVSKIEIAAGLGQGRLDDGLETLIERYLITTEELPLDKHLVKMERDRLFNSLVRFSKTVLFLANHQILLGNANQDRPRGLTKNTIDKNTQVLQAVGNSILNQVDEIYHRERYEEDIDKRGPREALAMKVAFPKYATDAVDQLITHMQAEAEISHTLLLKKDATAKKLQSEIQTLKTSLSKQEEIAKKSKSTWTTAKEIRDGWADHSGTLFTTSGGTTTGGNVNGPMSQGTIQAPFFQKSFPVSVPETAQIQGGTTTGGVTHGGHFNTLILQESTTTGGKILSGTITNGQIDTTASKVDVTLPNQNQSLLLDALTIMDPQITGGQVTGLTFSGGNAILSKISVMDAEITNADWSTSNGTTTINASSQISGKISGDAEFKGILTPGATLNNRDLVTGLAKPSDIKGAELSNATIQLTELKLGNLSYKISKTGSQSIPGLIVSDQKIKVKNVHFDWTSTAKTLTGEIQNKKLHGKLTQLPLSNWSISIKDGIKPILTNIIIEGGQINGNLTIETNHATFPNGAVSLAKVDVIDLDTQNNLTLTNLDAKDVWIDLANQATNGTQTLQRGMMSQATLAKVIITKATIHNPKLLKGQLNGSITDGLLDPTHQAVGGTASGGNLTSTITKGRTFGGITTGAIVTKATFQLENHMSGQLKLVPGLRLKSGTLEVATVNNGKLDPGALPIHGMLTGHTVSNFEISNATIKNAVIETASGKLINATIKHAHLQNAKIEKTTFNGVTTSGSGQHSPVNSTIRGGTISGIFVGPNAELVVGKAEEISVGNIAVPTGIVTDGITTGGTSEYAAFLKSVIQKSGSTPLTYQAFQQTITHEINTTIQAEQNEIRKEHLQKWKSQVGNLPNLETSLPSNMKTATASIWAHAMTLEFLNKINVTTASFLKKNKIYQQAATKLLSVEASIKSKNAELDARIQSYKKQYKTAQDLLILLKTPLLKHLAQQDRLTSSDQIYSEMVKILERKKAEDLQSVAQKPSSTDPPAKNTKFDTTIRIVGSKPEPLRVPSPSEIQGLDSKEVMDQLIATLKYEYIAAVREGGEDSPISTQIKNSIGTAYAQRAAMVQIRPAFAFLRSSYPSTALQDDASLEWENMLTQNAFRSTPLSTNPLSGSPWFSDPRHKIQSQIDKQFWHSVNRIRLNGAGNTNYVLMKDDIGNWTVKNYSANPEDIIRSTTNLAMFGLGSGVGRNLVGLNQLRTVTPNQEGQGNIPAAVPTTAAPNNVATEDSSNPQTEDSSLLGRQFDKFEKLYQEQTNTDLVAADTLTKELGSNIKGIWKNNSEVNTRANNLPAMIDEINAKHLTSLQNMPTETKAREKEILNRITAVKKFHREAELRILDKQPAAGAEDSEETKNHAAYKTALKLMTGQVQKELLGFISTRQQTVGKFKTQATVLHDSVTK